MTAEIDRIGLIMPIQSQYSSLHYFIKALGAGLERCGISIQFFDPNRLQGAAGLAEAIHEFDPQLVIAMNSFMMDSSGAPLWNHIQTPYLAYLVDLPHQFIPFEAPSRVIIASVDRRAFHFFKGHLKHSSSLFLPHAVEAELVAKPEKERPYPVSLFATCVDYENFQARWRQEYPKDVTELLEGVIEEAEKKPEKDLLGIILDKAGDSSRLEAMGGVNSSFLADIWCLSDLYIRGKARVELVKSIHSHQVHIWGQSMGGRGWQHYLAKDKKNVTIHPPVSFDKNLDLMRESRLVLNSFPIFKEGVHERVLSGMACGAVVLADQTPFMRKEFIDKEELFLFDTYRLEEIDMQISAILSDEDQCEQVAKRAKKKIRMSYTWDVRAEELLEKASVILCKE